MCLLIIFTYAFLRLSIFSEKVPIMEHTAVASNLPHTKIPNKLHQKVFLHDYFSKYKSPLIYNSYNSQTVTQKISIGKCSCPLPLGD